MKLGTFAGRFLPAFACRIMRKPTLLSSLLCAVALLVLASPVQAQSVLWVSADGSDGNACSQTSPCATFAGVIAKGNVAQINCLTSGDYGPFTITASITIDCGAGSIGNVSVGQDGTAIAINASAGATVVLRHLSLNGVSASYGISSGAGNGTLIVEDCAVQGFTWGISFVPTSANRGLLQVTNSQIFNASFGILIATSSGQIDSVMLNHVELVGNSFGLSTGGDGVVAGTMRQSVVAENSHGIVASGQIYFSVEESSIIDNSIGVSIDSPAGVVTIGASTIGGNQIGVEPISGSLISFGNNQMSTNGTNGTFTSITALQ
jgi:hypothetical protein